MLDKLHRHFYETKRILYDSFIVILLLCHFSPKFKHVNFKVIILRKLREWTYSDILIGNVDDLIIHLNDVDMNKLIWFDVHFEMIFA